MSVVVRNIRRANKAAVEGREEPWRKQLAAGAPGLDFPKMHEKRLPKGVKFIGAPEESRRSPFLVR